jgi:hypothetical protein
VTIALLSWQMDVSERRRYTTFCLRPYYRLLVELRVCFARRREESGVDFFEGSSRLIMLLRLLFEDGSYGHRE